MEEKPEKESSSDNEPIDEAEGKKIDMDNFLHHFFNKDSHKNKPKIIADKTTIMLSKSHHDE